VQIAFRVLLLPALFGVAAGCVTVDPRKTFPAVSADVQARTGYRVVWATGSAEDAAVRTEVDRLLTVELTAAAAVQIALLNNQRLQAAYEDVGIAQAGLVQAGLLKNPVLDGSVRFPSGGGTATVDVGVMVDFLQLLYIPMRKRLAAGELEAAQLGVTQKVLMTADQTRRAWVRAVAARQRLELQRNMAAASSAAADLTRRLREAGNTTALEQARQQAFAEMGALGLAEAEAEVMESEEELAGWMGLDATRSAVKVPERLPEVPVEREDPAGAQKWAVEHSLELALGRNEIEGLGRQLGVTRPMGWLSDLELGASFERDDAGTVAVGPAVAVPLPLFSQGQPAVAAAEARLRQARRMYLATATTVARETRSAVRAVELARAKVERLRGVVVPLQVKVTAESQREYNGMLIGAFELLAAKGQEIEAGGMYVRAQADYWMAKGRLETLMAGGGGLMSGEVEVFSRQANPAGGK
jgi:outer membrane protein, heavy metal efflux system